MSDGTRIGYDEAAYLCDDLIRHLERFCDVIRVAGSIRRKRRFIGDIELVIVPKYLTPQKVEQVSMLNALPDVHIELDKKNLTFVAIKEMAGLYDGNFFRLKQQDKKNGEKYKKYEIYSQSLDVWVQVDMFFATLENFGLIYLLRTGPKDFSKFMLTRSKHNGALPEGYYTVKGNLHFDGESIRTPTEKEIFDINGYQYLAPDARDDWKAALRLAVNQSKPRLSNGWETI